MNDFTQSKAFNCLLDEAENNPNAMQLLEIINLSLESLIFFKENNIENRVQIEAYNLNKLTNYITEIYEDQ
jgi:hypothetical protein